MIGKSVLISSSCISSAIGDTTFDAAISSLNSACGFSKTLVKLSGDILILNTKKSTIPNNSTNNVPVLPI